MANKKKILVLIDWFLPGYRAGGPIQSVSNLLELLKHEYEFAIITKDTDHQSNVPYPNIESNTWIDREGYRIYYYSDAYISMSRLKDLVLAEQCDYLYINSMYSVPFTIWPLLLFGRKKQAFQIVLSPRGMLQPGSVTIKAWKKVPFLKLVRWSGIPRNIRWFATNEDEKSFMEGHFGQGLDIRIASNIPRQLQHPWKSLPKRSGAARFVFTSRVSPIKNLEFFIGLLKDAKGEVIFDIYGTKEEDSYWAICERAIAALPPNVSVNYKGEVPQPQVAEVLSNYHFFVSMSKGENFGHAIFEAMIAGRPVLIGDRTHWHNLAPQKVGWDTPLDQPAAHQKVIAQCIAMGQEEYDTWSLAAWSFAKRYKESPEILEKVRKIFD